MKKILLLVFGLFCLSAVAQRSVTFIVKGGTQASNVIFNDESAGKLKVSYRAGLGFDIKFYGTPSTELSIQPWLNFVGKGYKNSSKDNQTVIDQRLDYLEVPVLFNARFFLSNDFNIYIHGGPYFAFAVNGSKYEKDDLVDGAYNPFVGQGENLAELKRLDIGIHIGTGVEYKRFLLGFGAQYGFSNINNRYGLSEISTDNKKQNNVGFFATVGYRI